MIKLQPYQQRVINEKTELDDKLASLDAFITLNPVFSTLDAIEQLLLLEQYDIMCKYSKILNSRIVEFKTKNEQ